MLSIFFAKTYLLLFLLQRSYALEASITSVTYSGSGCPVGSVSTSRDVKFTTLSQGLDNLALYVGPGTKVSDHRKDCIMDISFNVLAEAGECGRIVVNRQGLSLTGYAIMEMNDTVAIKIGYEWISASGVVCGHPFSFVK